MQESQLEVISALRARITNALESITEEVMIIFEEKLEKVISEIEEEILDEDLDSTPQVSTEIQNVLEEQRRIERALNGQ